MADTALTPQQLVEAGRAVIRADLDPDGTGRPDLTDGSDLTLALSVNAAMGTRNAAYTADRAAARYRTSATGDDLDTVAVDQFNTKRKGEAFSTVVVYLQRGGSTATTIPKGSRFAVPAATGQDEVVFAADDDVSTSSTTVAVPCTCVTAGKVGNVTYASITRIVDELPVTSWAIYTPTIGAGVLAGRGQDGADLTAPEDAAGGEDREEDPDLSTRLGLLTSDATRRPGTKDAILFGALETPGVRYATIVEPADGTVVLFVGDAGYGYNTTLAANVRSNLNSGTYSTAGVPGYRAFGVPVLVRPFTRTRVYVTATVYMNQPTYRYDVSALLAKAVANATAYFVARPFQDEYVQNKIEQALLACDPDTQNVSVTLSPSATLRLASASYSGATSTVIYYVDDLSWRITFSGPQTQ